MGLILNFDKEGNRVPDYDNNIKGLLYLDDAEDWAAEKSDSIFGPEPHKIDRVKLYQRVRENTAHANLFFWNHIWPVALGCKNTARNINLLSELKKDEQLVMALGGIEVNPDICELAGVMKGLGYTEKFEYRSRAHIPRSMLAAEALMKEFEVPDELIEPVLSCIRTYDHKFRISNLPALENIIVHDINALNYFTFHVEDVVNYWGWCLEHPDPISHIIKRAGKVYDKIFLDYFKRMAKKLKDEFINELKVQKSDPRRTRSISMDHFLESLNSNGEENGWSNGPRLVVVEPPPFIYVI